MYHKTTKINKENIFICKEKIFLKYKEWECILLRENKVKRLKKEGKHRTKSEYWRRGREL